MKLSKIRVAKISETQMSAKELLAKLNSKKENQITVSKSKRSINVPFKAVLVIKNATEGYVKILDKTIADKLEANYATILENNGVPCIALFTKEYMKKQVAIHGKEAQITTPKGGIRDNSLNGLANKPSKGKLAAGSSVAAIVGLQFLGVTPEQVDNGTKVSVTLVPSTVTETYTTSMVKDPVTNLFPEEVVEMECWNMVVEENPVLITSANEDVEGEEDEEDELGNDEIGGDIEDDDIEA